MLLFPESLYFDTQLTNYLKEDDFSKQLHDKKIDGVYQRQKYRTFNVLEDHAIYAKSVRWKSVNLHILTLVFTNIPANVSF